MGKLIASVIVHALILVMVPFQPNRGLFVNDGSFLSFRPRVQNNDGLPPHLVRFHKSESEKQESEIRRLHEEIRLLRLKQLKSDK